MRLMICLLALLVFGSPAHAALKVVGNPDHEAMLQSDDPQLEANKRLVYDMWRTLLDARQVEMADKFLAEDYMQHNPNAETGLQGFKDYFNALGLEPQPVPDRVQRDIVSIVAEGDLVVISFVQELPEPEDESKTYTTTWFDMFRVKDGKIVEHWDGATK